MTNPVINGVEPITDAIRLLMDVTIRLGAPKPMVLAVHPSEQNDHGLKEGQLIGTSSTELLPSCRGVVVVFASTAEDVQSLVDAVTQWSDRS